MKSNGQRLYEHKYPRQLAVVLYEKRHFATPNDIIIIDNPAYPTPWLLLTDRARESWEKTAVGHSLFSAT